MDRKITVRFYQIQRHRETDLGFSECLQQIRENYHGVYSEIDEDLYIRLERCSFEGGYIKGEFTRKQTVNLPPKVITGSLEASTDPIAHRAAFQYHVEHGVLAVEHNRNGMSLARINKYIIDVLDHAGFEFFPVITERAWHMLISGTPRKLTLRVANPQNLSVAESNSSARSITQNLIAMKDVFGGPVVEAAVGFGRGGRDSSLNKNNIISVLRHFLSPINQSNIKKIQVKLDGEADPIDLLTEQLKFKHTLNLDDSDVNVHYQTRKVYLESSFRKNMSLIEEIYGRVAA